MSISSGRAMPSAQALRCLAHCDTPTSPINVSGHEILAVRDLAAKFGELFGREPVIVGKEEPTAWLTDTSQAVKLFGLPIVDTAQLIKWTADWVSRVDAEPRQAHQIRGARWPILSTSPSFSSAPADAPAGLALSTEAHWNQNEADWRFFLSQGNRVRRARRERRSGRDRGAVALYRPATPGSAWCW